MSTWSRNVKKLIRSIIERWKTRTIDIIGGAIAATMLIIITGAGSDIKQLVLIGNTVQAESARNDLQDARLEVIEQFIKDDRSWKDQFSLALIGRVIQP